MPFSARRLDDAPAEIARDGRRRGRAQPFARRAQIGIRGRDFAADGGQGNIVEARRDIERIDDRRSPIRARRAAAPARGKRIRFDDEALGVDAPFRIDAERNGSGDKNRAVESPPIRMRAFDRRRRRDRPRRARRPRSRRRRAPSDRNRRRPRRKRVERQRGGGDFGEARKRPADRFAPHARARGGRDGRRDHRRARPVGEKLVRAAFPNAQQKFEFAPFRGARRDQAAFVAQRNIVDQHDARRAVFRRQPQNRLARARPPRARQIFLPIRPRLIAQRGQSGGDFGWIEFLRRFVVAGRQVDDRRGQKHIEPPFAVAPKFGAIGRHPAAVGEARARRFEADELRVPAEAQARAREIQFESGVRAQHLVQARARPFGLFAQQKIHAFERQQRRYRRRRRRDEETKQNAQNHRQGAL